MTLALAMVRRDGQIARSHLTLALAMVRRDWQIARSHSLPFLFDAAALVAAAALFYYLGRHVATRSDHGFFAFAVAGLAFLRLNTAVPRVLDSVGAEVAGGSLELLVSGPQPAGIVALGTAAFELLRGLAQAAAFIVLAVVVFGAPFPHRAGGIAAVVTGLLGGTLVFAGLACGAIGVLMVVHQAGAVGSLVTVVMPILAGAYFPIATLPQPLETIAAVLPFRLAVDVMRDGLLRGRLDLGAAGLLAAEAAAFLVLGLLVAGAGVERARRTGALART